MKIHTLIGFLAAGAVLWFGVLSPAARPDVFLDPHALILVFGGTLAAALIAYPFQQFEDLANFLVMAAIFPTRKSLPKAVEHLLILSGHPDFTMLETELRKDMHPYLVEGYLLAKRSDLTSAELKFVLQSRHHRFKERYAWDARALSALGKFPPAFGLLGASAGMIAMMTNLGAAGKDSIGPSMAIALVATFWGIAIANLLFLPLADHATRLNSEDTQLRLMISTALVMIHERVRPSVLLEHLIGFLPLAQRNNPRFHQATARAQRALTDAAKPELKAVPGGEVGGGGGRVP